MGSDRGAIRGEAPSKYYLSHKIHNVKVRGRKDDPLKPSRKIQHLVLGNTYTKGLINFLCFKKVHET